MWKEITDAQRDGETYYVLSWNWDKPQNAYMSLTDGVWLLSDFLIYAYPTHYWDFGLDTPLPPPTKVGK